MLKYSIYIIILFFTVSLAQDQEIAIDEDYGDRLKIGYVWSGDLSFNPLQINSDYDKEFANLVFGDGLFTTNDSGSIIPNIVLDYKLLSSTVLRFKLRSDLKYHDSATITANDVKKTFELYKKFASQSQRFYNASIINSIETYGNDVVRFKLIQPLPEFLETLGQLPILPTSICSRLLKFDSISDFPPVKPVGFGQFIFSNYETKRSVTLNAYKNHVIRKSYLNGIDFLFYDSQDLLLNAFLREEVDLIQIHDKSEIQKIKQFSKDIIYLEDDSRTLYYINLNTRVEPFNNFSIRHAINYGINKNQIYSSLFGNNTNLSGNKLNTNYSESLKIFTPFDYKPHDAFQILMNNNYKKNSLGKLIKNNKELEFELFINKGSTFEEFIARIIAINLGEIGISVNPISIESATLAKRISNGQYQAVLKEYNFNPNIKNVTIRNFYYNELNDVNGFKNFKNLSFDILIDFIEKNQNGYESQNLDQRFQNLLNRYAPCIFLFFKDTNVCAINPRFKNILISKTNSSGIEVNQFKPKHEWFVKRINHKY